MKQVKLALQETTCHGLPRTVSNKPIYVRITWLIIFLLTLALFIKGLYEFVVKLQSRQVTTSLDADALKFKFPDAYVCFENPSSASYSARIDAKTADDINAGLRNAENSVYEFLFGINVTESDAREIVAKCSSLLPRSLPYPLLVNALAHRTEQAIIECSAAYKAGNGTLTAESFEPTSFYDAAMLRCMKVNVSGRLQEKILRSKSSSGVTLTLLIDTTAIELPPGLKDNNSSTEFKIFYPSQETLIPLFDWPLASILDASNLDRRAGVRVFLAPPGEYPSDFVNSFSLGPGKYHTVEIGMTQQVYKDGQFDCLSDTPDVQFVNPYDQTPYSHAYSYSYCYYYEYHRRFQSIHNISGDISPMPWELRGSEYLLSVNNILKMSKLDSAARRSMAAFEQQAQAACQSKKMCSTLDYSVSISSADWPTQSSLAPFVSSSIKKAWTKAKAKNLSVPALDFLLTGNASSVASYVRSNLLKVHFKPHRVLCDQVTFSIDYGLPNFISDIGGIMGIYLGMSLLTLCELLELIYEVIRSRKVECQISPMPTDSMERDSSEPA